MNKRALVWEGCSNVRDLGGLQTWTGCLTRFGSIVRADTPSRLSPKGWEALYAYGIRTLISLRTIGKEEPELDVIPPYADIATISLAIEDLTDREFLEKWAMTDLWCTPLYYRDALQRWPHRHAAVISAIAQAQPGGVLFHCIRGNDRTGIIALLVLALAGVTPEDIIADYSLSPDPERNELLRGAGSSISAALTSALDWLDIDEYLLKGGARPEDIATVRQRMVES